MTPAEYRTHKWAMQVAIRTLGVARCAEICGGCAEASVYRYANPNEPHIVRLDWAQELDRELWQRHGLTPFREVFEINAGAPMHERVAAQLARMAEQMKAGVAA